MSIETRVSSVLRCVPRRGVALGAVIVIGVLAGACRGGSGSVDSAVAGGDAGAIEVDALNYEVTSDRYQRWLEAQRSLDAISGLAEPPSLDPARFTDADVDRATRYLESDPRARAALGRAGISARDYVLTTLALDQALVASASPDAGAGESRGSPARSNGSARPAGGAAGAGSGRASGSRVAERPADGRASEPARRPRTRTRYRNLPPTNAELVERNREDIARVRSGMRFRIVQERVDTAYVDYPADPATTSPAVPAGTTIALRSDTRVCTTTHRPGDRVNATLTAPVSGTTRAPVIPAGASASLSVVGTRSGAAGAPMEFTLNSITVDGRTYAVAGSGVASRVERVRAGSARRDAQKVAGGAAIGAAAGQVLGRDTKSTVIGAAVGAAAGAAAAGASARYDTCVPAGAPIQVTLRDALNLRV